MCFEGFYESRMSEGEAQKSLKTGEENRRAESPKLVKNDSQRARKYKKLQPRPAAEIRRSLKLGTGGDLRNGGYNHH